MTVIVVSDVHGRTDRLEEVLSRNPRADALLFLGDGIRDLPEHVINTPTRLFGGVRGNCDGFTALHGDRFPEELFINLDAYTVMMMHGHRFSVKSGTDAAVAYAISRGANVLLYGHTHVPESRYLPAGTSIGEKTLEKPFYLFNPGSLGAPHDGVPRFGTIELRRGQLLFSHGELT